MKSWNKARRALLILMVLLMAVTVFAGCSGDEPKNIAGTITQTEAPVSEPAGETEPAAQPTEETAVEPTEETVAEENPVSLGRMEGGVYTNEYAGFGCSLDSTWEYYTAEELQALPGEAADLFEGSEFGDALQELQQIADMKAESVEELASINILYQKLGLQERLTYAMMTEEQIIDATLEQKDLLVETYAQGGIDVSEMTKETVTFLGEEHTALRTVAQTEGIDYYVLQVFDYHLGEYSVTLTLGSFVEDKTAELLELFYKVD